MASSSAIRLSPYRSLAEVPESPDLEKLRASYSVVRVIHFDPDPDQELKALRMARDGIVYTMPEKKMVVMATVWDLPLIKASLKDRGVDLNTAEGKEIAEKEIRALRSWTQLELAVDSYSSRLFDPAAWTLWLEDRDRRIYKPLRINRVTKDENVPGVAANVAGQQSESPSYAIYRSRLHVYFPKINLSAVSPLTIHLRNADNTQQILLGFMVRGGSASDLPPLLSELPDLPGETSPTPSPTPPPTPTPTDPLALKKMHFDRATTLYLNGEYEDAIKEWQEVLKIDPHHERSKLKIKKTQKKLADSKREKRTVFKNQKQREMQVHFLLASEYYKNGNYQQAIAEWKEVLKIDPDHELAQRKIKKAEALMRNTGR